MLRSSYPRKEIMLHKINPPHSIARRYFFKDCGIGLGKMALSSLLADQMMARPLLGANENPVPSAALDKTSSVSSVHKGPFAPKPPHFAAKAKAVIHLFMAGAPS